MKIYIMCGLPGSGKSTKAKELVDDNTIIINKDSIRLMLFGEYAFKSKFEPLVNQIVQKTIILGLESSMDLIIDETNITKEKRNTLLSFIGQEYETRFTNKLDIVFIYCSENKNNLLARMIHPKGQDKDTWNNVITSMKKVFEIPTKEEISKYKKLHLNMNFKLEELKMKKEEFENIGKVLIF